MGSLVFWSEKNAKIADRNPDFPSFPHPVERLAFDYKLPVTSNFLTPLSLNQQP